jgi:large conductance mechanosensitive channel
MVKGFKDFVLRGNVVDLAVAVVIGVAFGALVSSFVSKIITPVLNALPGAKSTGLGFSLRGGLKSQATFVDVSGLINAVIVFVLTALVVYLLFVVPMNTLAERRKRGVEPEPVAPAEDILLLQEIRDLLAGRNGAV